MKTFVHSLFLLTLCAFLLSTLAIAMPNTPMDGFYVNDFAGVISSKDAEAMASLGAQLESKTSAQVVAVAVNFFNGLEGDVYAYELFNTWQLGNKDKDNGVLLVLSVGDREVRTMVGAGLDSLLTPSLAMSIVDDYGMNAFGEGDYSGGMRATYAALCARVAAIYGVTLTANGSSALQPYLQNNSPTRQTAGGFGGELMLTLIILAIILLVMRRGTRAYRGGTYNGGPYEGNYGGGCAPRGYRGGTGGFWRGIMIGSMLNRSRPTQPTFGTNNRPTNAPTVRPSNPGGILGGGKSFSASSRGGGFTPRSGGGGASRGSGGGRKF